MLGEVVLTADDVTDDGFALRSGFGDKVLSVDRVDVRWLSFRHETVVRVVCIAVVGLALRQVLRLEVFLVDALFLHWKRFIKLRFQIADLMCAIALHMIFENIPQMLVHQGILSIIHSSVGFVEFAVIDFWKGLRVFA